MIEAALLDRDAPVEHERLGIIGRTGRVEHGAGRDRVVGHQMRMHQGQLDASDLIGLAARPSEDRQGIGKHLDRARMITGLKAGVAQLAQGARLEVGAVRRVGERDGLAKAALGLTEPVEVGGSQTKVRGVDGPVRGFGRIGAEFDRKTSGRHRLLPAACLALHHRELVLQKGEVRAVAGVAGIEESNRASKIAARCLPILGSCSVAGRPDEVGRSLSYGRYRP